MFRMNRLRSSRYATNSVFVAAFGAAALNPQYPYKFKAIAPASEGITFVAAKAGKQAVGGVLHLSVCTAANCVVDKVPRDVTIEVK
jgi:hypothetical protein